MLVPLNAGDFACFATNAGRNVDVFADRFLAPRALAGNRSGMGRDFLNLERLWIAHFSDSPVVNAPCYSRLPGCCRQGL